MIETHCQDRQARKPSHRSERQGTARSLAGCKEERILFMDEIKVVPYIPDEDYDNPAMVVDFYEFTMANCLFLHGFKDTTLVFDMFFR